MKNVSIITSVFLLLSASICLSQHPVDQGKQLFHGGKYDDAKSIFEEVLRSDRHNAEANYFLGRIYFQSGAFDESEDYLEKAIEADEKKIDYHLSLATVYQEKTRRASFLSAPFLARKWLNELERAFELDPRYLEARKRLIQYYLNAPGIGGGDKEKGKRLAGETIELDEIQGRLLLASALNRTDKTELAIEEYNRVLKLDPQNGSAHNSLGYIFLKRKDFGAAEINFTKYIEVAPQNPNAYDSMGEYYSQRGKADEAITQFQKALTVDAKFSESRFKLAQAFAEKKMKKEAIHHLQTLLKLTPTHIRANEAKDLLEDLQD